VGRTALDQGRFDGGGGCDLRPFDDRCADQPLAVDLIEHNGVFGIEPHRLEGDGNEFFADHPASDDSRNDALAGRFHKDIFDVARFGSVGGSDDTLVLANTETRVFSRKCRCG